MSNFTGNGFSGISFWHQTYPSIVFLNDFMRDWLLAYRIEIISLGCPIFHLCIILTHAVFAVGRVCTMLTWWSGHCGQEMFFLSDEKGSKHIKQICFYFRIWQIFTAHQPKNSHVSKIILWMVNKTSPTIYNFLTWEKC